MMYPFMTLDDNTEIVHSEMQPDHRVKVYIEKPDEKDCFHSAVCYLPDYTWEDVSGFTPAEIDRYQKFLESTAHLILQFSQEGGVENAAGFLKSVPTGSTSGPTKMIRWNPFMSMFHRVLPAATRPRSGSPGPGNAICATTIPTFRPVSCETSWPSSKHEAMK
mgnify:CR=1 FL=1